MKHQDQKPMETLESQMSESPEERQDRSYVTKSYCAPQVFLVGKAKRLMAGSVRGNHSEVDWTSHFS
jgi:hypothetical protein